MNQLAVVTIVGLLSCGIVDSDRKSDVVGHEPRLTRSLEDIRASIKNLQKILVHVDEEATLTLYEGLPHPVWYPEQLDSELEQKETIKRFGFNFYENPNAVSPNHAKELRRLLRQRKTFSKFGGFKGCGGFHPDFALVWKSGEAQVELHICFGCREMRAYSNEFEVYCDIEEIDGGLRKLLSEYRKQRPDPDLKSEKK